jgi:hypothetical protein
VEWDAESITEETKARTQILRTNQLTTQKRERFAKRETRKHYKKKNQEKQQTSTSKRETYCNDTLERQTTMLSSITTKHVPKQ